MKIKAAILNSMGAKPPYATSKPLSIEEIDLDPPGYDEVLVKIAAAGLCHSDLSVINGNRPRPVPMALGHEAAGIVEEIGAGVTDLKKGDHVVMVFMPSCGHCIPCAEGRPALCEPGAAANTTGNLLSGQWRLHRGTQAINHHLGVSAFADHATVSRRSLVPIDPELPLDIAALFGCAVLTGVGAIVNTARISPGSSVAIIGLGGVGLAALLGAAMAGASRIVSVDLSKEKLALARELGATDVFSAASDTSADEIREATKGGVHYSFETSGSTKAMELLIVISNPLFPLSDGISRFHTILVPNL
jgi:alcohol dehydrogenase